MMNSPKALDRTAMSAVAGDFVASCVPAALMAVGQLGRWPMKPLAVCGFD